MDIYQLAFPAKPNGYTRFSDGLVRLASLISNIRLYWGDNSIVVVVPLAST